jgi:hypothetical protein
MNALRLACLWCIGFPLLLLFAFILLVFTTVTRDQAYDI